MQQNLPKLLQQSHKQKRKQTPKVNRKRRRKEIGVANMARNIHILCAYWGFLLMAVHLGLHWNMMLRILERALPMKGIAKILGLLIAVYGGYAFYKREIVNYLFLRSHFVFFGPEESLGVFLLDYIYIAMMGMIVFITYYGCRLAERIKAKK